MTWSIIFIGLIAAGIIASIAIGTVVSVLMKANNKTISPKKAAPHLVGLIWILPVVAVLLLLALPVFVVFWISLSHRDVSPATLTVVSAIDRSSAGSVSVEYSKSTTSLTPELPSPTTKRDSDTLTTSNVEEPSEIVLDIPELPDWVLAGEVNSEDSRLLVLASEQYASVDRARRNVLRDAARVVLEDFQRTHKGLGSWTLPDDLVDKHAVQQEYVEKIARQTSLNPFLVYRVYFQVELSPTVRAAVFENWRSQTVTSRLWMVGGLLGFVTMILGITATYLRLDAMTNGAYRLRLKLASVSFLVVGGLGLAALIQLKLID